MRTGLLPLAAAALIALPALAQPGPGGPPAKPAAEKKVAGPPVYDETADAKADVAAALAKAKAENKRVLVTLGANWCGWCRSLDGTFTKNEKVAAELAKAYVPVKVDVGRMKPDSDRLKQNLDLAVSWGADVKQGIPLLVVLDASGKAVKVQETGALEKGKGHDPEKVIAFLKASSGR